MKRPIIRLRQWPRFFLVNAVVTAVLACTSSDHHSSSLRLGTNVWLGYEPLHLAQELGFFQNKNIHLTEYSSTTQVLRAYRNNAIDAAALTLDEVLQLVDQGYTPKIILVTDFSNGADAVVAQAELKHFKDLEGRKIGVENSALGAFFISRALQINEMKAEQIQLVPLEIGEQRQAFEIRKVDAVVTFEPVRSQLLNNGARSLFDSSQIAGEIVDVLVVKQSVLSAKPEQIDAIMSGWFRALEYMKHNKVQATGIMASRLKLKPDAVTEAFKLIKIPDETENRVLLGNDSSAKLRTTAKSLSAIMCNQGLIEKTVAVDDLF